MSIIGTFSLIQGFQIFLHAFPTNWYTSFISGLSFKSSALMFDQSNFLSPKSMIFSDSDFFVFIIFIYLLKLVLILYEYISSSNFDSIVCKLVFCLQSLK